jgi:hypothetical protein
LQTIPQIAEALEDIHSRLVVLRYQILGVGQQKQKYRNWLDKTLPVIEQYKKISKTNQGQKHGTKRYASRTQRLHCLQFVKKA